MEHDERAQGYLSDSEQPDLFLNENGSTTIHRQSDESTTSWLAKLRFQTFTTPSNTSRGTSFSHAKTTSRTRLDRVFSMPRQSPSSIVEKSDGSSKTAKTYRFLDSGIKSAHDPNPLKLGSESMISAKNYNSLSAEQRLDARDNGSHVKEAQICSPLVGVKLFKDSPCNTLNGSHETRKPVETPNYSWRVNEWLAKSFPINQDRPSAKAIECGEAEGTIAIEDDIVEYDEGFENQFGLVKSRSIPYANDEPVDAIEEGEHECDPLCTTYVPQILGNACATAHGTQGVSIKDLFKLGTAKTLTQKPVSGKRRRSDWSEFHGSSLPSQEFQTPRRSVFATPPKKVGGEGLDISEFSDEESQFHGPDIDCSLASKLFHAGPLGTLVSNTCTSEVVRNEDPESSSLLQNEERGVGNSWISLLHDASPKLPHPPRFPNRNSRRSCGELSRQLQRFEERQEFEIRQLRAKSERCSSAAMPNTDARQSGIVLLLRRTFCGPVVLFTAQLCIKSSTETENESNKGSSSSMLCNVFFSINASKTVSEVLCEGAVLKVFQPWSILSTADGELPIVFCSERVQLLRHLHSSDDINAELIRMCDNSTSMVHSSDHIQNGLFILSRGSLNEFPLHEFECGHSEDSLEVPDSPIVSIDRLNSWSSRVSISGKILYAYPRGLLLRMEAPITTAILPKWAEELADTTSIHPSSFWIIDDRNQACRIHIPVEFEMDWIDVLMAISGSRILVSNLSVLGRARKEIYKDSAASKEIRVSEYILEVGVMSRYQIIHSADAQSDPKAIHGNEQIVTLKSLYDQVGSLSRASIIVQVLSIHVADPFETNMKERLELELCVRDVSSAYTPVNNVLMRVIEPSQCLACFGVLKNHDVIFVRRARVEVYPISSSLRPTFALVVDCLSQVHLIGTQSPEASFRSCTFGFCLPVVTEGAIRKEFTITNQFDLLDMIQSPADHMIKRVGLGFRDAFLTFHGDIIQVGPLLFLEVCPSCACDQLRYIQRNEPPTGTGYLCSKCGEVCNEPRRVLRPIRLRLNCGVEIWLTSGIAMALLPRLGGSYEFDHLEAQHILTGRSIRGICIQRTACRASKAESASTSGATVEDEWKLYVSHVVECI